MTVAKYSKPKPVRQPRRGRRVVSPDTPAPNAPESLKAAWWRQHVLRLTRPEMADLTGLPMDQIRRLEAGSVKSAKTWQRYRLICAALAAGVQFNWTEVKIDLPQGPSVFNS